MIMRTPSLAGLAIAWVWAVAATPALAQLDAERILQAVVGIDTEVPSDARTAGRLGTERHGNGVVIDGDGLVLTIGYLIMEASAADLVLQDGRRVSAEIVAYDHESGFGLVRAHEPLDIEPLTLGRTADAEIGEQMIVATRGGPQDARGTIVVARREFAGTWEYLLDEAIFTSPPHPRFSGAALIDSTGTLVGIGSLFVGNADTGAEPKPGNMFVPIEELRPVLADLLDSGRRAGPLRPWLGLTPELVRGHVFVNRVADGGPAARAGIAAGDLVLGVAGAPVTSLAALYRALWAAGDAGDVVELAVVSAGGGMRTVEVTTINRYDWLRLEPTF